MHSRCILWGWGHGLWLSMDMGGQWDILLLLVISIGGPTTTVSQPTLRKHVEIVTANQFWTQNRCWLHGNWLLATSGYPCNCTRITAQQHSWHTRTNACQLVHNILSRELCYLRLWHWIKFYAKVNQLAHSLSSTTLIIGRGIVIHGGIGDSRQARILSRLTKWMNKDWKREGEGWQRMAYWRKISVRGGHKVRFWYLLLCAFLQSLSVLYMTVVSSETSIELIVDLQQALWN